MRKLLAVMAVCFSLGCLRMYWVIRTVDKAANEPIRFKPPPPPPEPTPEEKTLARVKEEINQAMGEDRTVDVQKVSRLPKGHQVIYWSMFFERRVGWGFAGYFWEYGDQYNKPVLEALQTVGATSRVNAMNLAIRTFDEKRKEFEALRKRGNDACYARWCEDADLARCDNMLRGNEKMADIHFRYVHDHPELFAPKQASRQ